MIEGLLPLLRGWRYSIREVSGVEFSGEYELLSVENPGWVQYAVVEVSDPDAVMYIGGFGPGGAYVGATVSARMLWRARDTAWEAMGAFLLRYDDEERRYAAAYSPRPWLAFYRGRAWLQAPRGATVTLYRAYVQLVEITNKGEFAASLREALGLAAPQAARLAAPALPPLPI